MRSAKAAWFALTLAGMVPSQDEGARIGVLIERLNSDTEWEKSAKSLVEIGAPAAALLGRALLPEVTTELGHLSFEERILVVLSRMGERGAAATQYVTAALWLLPAPMTAKLYRTLGDIGPYAQFDVRALDLASDMDRLTIRGRPVPGNLRDHEFESLIREASRARARLEKDEIMDWDDLSVMPRRNMLLNVFQAEWVIDRLPAGAITRSDTVPVLLSMLRQGYGSVSMSVERLQRRRAPVDVDAVIHGAAARALIRLIPRDPLCLPAYGYVLERDPDGDVRFEASVGIRQFGPRATQVLDEVLRALGDEDPRVVREAITLLGMMGSGGSKAVGKLEELTSHPDSQIAARARAALRAIRRS